MADQKELMMHRCAVFGTRKYFPGYPATLDYLKDCITKAVDEGFYTFLTCGNDGYELDAARFIAGLKQKDKRIHLVIVIPYPNRNRNWNTVMMFEEVCNAADFVKVVSIADDPDATKKATEWIVSNCLRIISATSSPGSRIKRLYDCDLSDKECIDVSVAWSEKEGVYIRTVAGEKESDDLEDALAHPAFPDNLLRDILGSRYADADGNPVNLPEDFTERITVVLSRYEGRIQQIIAMRYRDNLTLRQIGEQFDLSHERIRQLIQKCLRRLRYKTNLNYLMGITQEIAPMPVRNAAASAGSPNYDNDKGLSGEIVDTGRGYASSDTMSISELARRLSEQTKKTRNRTIRYGDIAAWLVAAGDLLDDSADGKSVKMPTEQGELHGIKRGERLNAAGLPYVGVYLEPAGQEYVIENLDRIVDYLESSE